MNVQRIVTLRIWGWGVGGLSENAHLKQVKQDRKYTTNTTYTYEIPGHK